MLLTIIGSWLVITGALNGNVSWQRFAVLLCLTLPGIVNRWSFYLLAGIVQSVFGFFVFSIAVIAAFLYVGDDGAALQTIWGFLMALSFFVASVIYLITGLKNDGKALTLPSSLFVVVYIVLTAVLFIDWQQSIQP